MPSKIIIKEIEALVPIAGPGDGVRPSAIFERYNKWSRTTVRQALTYLAEEGRIVFEGHNGFRHYRKPLPYERK